MISKTNAAIDCNNKQNLGSLQTTQHVLMVLQCFSEHVVFDALGLYDFGTNFHKDLDLREGDIL